MWIKEAVNVGLATVEIIGCGAEGADSGVREDKVQLEI